jgi:glycosyltransferase involved in cell wall biosynthesis
LKVLIGITSKNRAQILPKAIESALNQVYEQKEVWVFDDASADNTKDLQLLYPEVKWIISEEARGLVYARNLFMSQRNFDVFISLDDDAWFLEPNLIKNSIEYLTANLEVGAIAYDILSPDKSEKKHNEISFEQTNVFIGCGHLVRLDAVNEVGFYIPFPGYYGGEEKDLCIRLLDLDKNIVKFNGGYVWHDKTPVARDLPAQHRSGVCNDLVFCARRAPSVILFPYVIYKLLSHFKFAIKFNHGELLKATWAGMTDFFMNLLYRKLHRKPVRYRTLKKFIELS